MVVCSGAVSGMDYGLNVTGNPMPSLSVVSGPAGMAVSATGIVTWTPVVGTPGTYTATVRATNSVSSVDTSVVYTIYAAGTDLLAPDYPGLITVSNITRTSMTVNWVGATDNVGVTGYSISAYSRRCVRRVCVNTGGASATTAGSARSVTLTGLLPGLLYTVAVNAVDAAGNQGGRGTLSPVFTLP